VVVCSAEQNGVLKGLTWENESAGGDEHSHHSIQLSLIGQRGGSFGSSTMVFSQVFSTVLFLFTLVHETTSFSTIVPDLKSAHAPLLPTQTTSFSTNIPDLKLTWEPEVAAGIRKSCEETVPTTEEEEDRPYMVAVVGIPGSGKTTSAFILQEMLENLGCLVMPFDGYHYPLADLENFPNPVDAKYRRGAPDTFDSEALRRDLEKIRFGKGEKLYIPGFDHGVGDPEKDKYVFRRYQHKIVLCEGLYLLHWEQMQDYFDFSIFVDADVDMCMDRLKVRNLAIPGYSPEEIVARVDAVDRVNAMTVDESKKHAKLVVQSSW
jgi:pantothenate kinase